MERPASVEGLVVAGGVDAQGAEEFALLGHNPDLSASHEDVDGLVSVRGSNADGGVGLPALVGKAGLKANEGGARPLVRLWGGQAVTTEDAPDCAARGRRLSQAPGKVVGDGLGSGVVTRGEELLP